MRGSRLVWFCTITRDGLGQFSTHLVGLLGFLIMFGSGFGLLDPSLTTTGAMKLFPFKPHPQTVQFIAELFWLRPLILLLLLVSFSKNQKMHFRNKYHMMWVLQLLSLIFLQQKWANFKSVYIGAKIKTTEADIPVSSYNVDTTTPEKKHNLKK